MRKREIMQFECSRDLIGPALFTLTIREESSEREGETEIHRISVRERGREKEGSRQQPSLLHSQVQGAP